MNLNSEISQFNLHSLGCSSALESVYRTIERLESFVTVRHHN